MSKTLVICKFEGNNKKVGIYINKINNNSKIQNFKYFKNLDISRNLDGNEKINKIMLIPCFEGYENQGLLLFIDDKIRGINIKSNAAIAPTEINLLKFNFDNFNEFHFIVYLDFLLILKFNNEKNEWNGKLYSLCIEDGTFFNEIENTSIMLEGLDKDAIFSFAEIKENKYLFAVNIKDKNPKIFYWQITSQLSGISTNYITSGETENIISEEISLANCVLNYFYHCFDKYPLLGAIEYNFKEYENKKQIKLSFFTGNQNDNIKTRLKNYINELRELCQQKKKYLLTILILVVLMNIKIILMRIQ